MLLYIYVFFVYCDGGGRCESERFNKFGSLDTYSLFAPKCLFVAKYSSCFLHIIHICYLLQYTQIHRLDTLYYDLKPVELENLFKFWNKIFKTKNKFGKGWGLIASVKHIVRFGGNLAQLFRYIPWTHVPSFLQIPILEKSAL